MKLMHVVFGDEREVEGFITDSAKDAAWSSTGRPKSRCTPVFGEMLREFIPAKCILPRRYALVFDTEAEALAALERLSK